MKLCTTTLALLWLVSIAQAQDKTFTVEVSSDTVLLGNYIELKFTIENFSTVDFEPPSLKDFDVISGPNTSTSMSLINGVMSQKSSYTYYIEPRDVGAWIIPPAFLKTESEIMETPPVEIITLPNPEGIVQPPHQAGKKFEHLFVVPEKQDTTPTKRGRKI